MDHLKQVTHWSHGSGKSAFAICLQLFCLHQMLKIQNQFLILKTKDKKLTNNINDKKQNTKGFLILSITGSPEPLSNRLLEGLLEKAKRSGLIIKKNKFLKEQEFSNSKLNQHLLNY